MAKELFAKTPMCDACGRKPAVAFTYFRPGRRLSLSGWNYTCNCTDDDDDYYITFEQFFGGPMGPVRWLAHMNEKVWMDWPDFMEMMGRFYGATRGEELVREAVLAS